MEEEKDQIRDCSTEENLVKHFPEVDKNLDNSSGIDTQTELSTEHKSDDIFSDDEESETIFNKSKSTLLNSLFEECKRSEETNQPSVNVTSSLDSNIIFENLSSEKSPIALNLQDTKQLTSIKETKFKNSESDRINDQDSNSLVEVFSSNQSPVKNVHDTMDNSAHCRVSEKYVNNNSQETLKSNVVLNLTNEHGKLNIPPKNYRPTLSEDSKLVKISLPTNPINIMQSNAQFLNKSRNFFNFITEKSSNIMEKTLLPHNIAERYNSIMKLADSNIRKQIEESSTSSESSSTDLTSSSETDLAKIPRTTDEPFNAVRFKDESGLSKFKSTTPTNEISRVSDDKHKNIENSLDVELKFKEYECKKQTLCPNDNSSEKALLENRLNSSLSTLNVSPLDSQENSPRPTSEDDSEADSSYRDDSIDSAISKSPNNELHNHPAYLALLRDYAISRKENEKLIERIAKFEEKSQKYDMEKSEGFQREEIVSMERTIDRLTNELKAAMASQESMNREFTIANKEREGMVMKYAVSEKQLIDVQRARDLAERRFKEVSKEHELLQGKLRQAQGERSRICSILDNKCTELVELQKQVDRLKEETNMKEVKLKYAQNKLKTEMDLQKETQQKLEVATAKINEIKEEGEQIRRNTQETIRKFQLSEENKAVSLDHQLKEQQAQLILERHVTEDRENIRLQLQKEVETLNHRQQALIEENTTFSLQLQGFQNDRESYESSLSNLKSIADQRQKEIAELLSQVSVLETLQFQLKQQEQTLAATKAQVVNFQQTNQELQMDMNSCRQREAHMLEFTQKLTDKNVRLQSEFTAIEAKNQRLEHEQGPLHERIVELVSKVKSLEESLATEQKRRVEDCEILAKHVAEQTQLAQNFSQKLEDSEGENAVLKRKHQLTLKEMTRELQHCRKRLEIFETASPGSSLGPTSRTGSSTSLNTGETINGALSDNSNYAEHTIQSVDRQSLIEKIIKMQKINVKKAEKIDFLEEHVRSLVEELQKKSKIIQNYILVENFDAMSTNERDRNKHIKSKRNAAELAKYGGIMASVYNHKVSDDHMTLELSLEINQKLQSVLEDTLLKNITLKDNIDTLGEEIAKLTMQIQQKQSAK